VDARSRGVSRGHDLEFLSSSCQKQGLHVNRELADVIHLLESENKVYGFRYFAFVSTGIPEIGYLRQVADELMITVTKEVEGMPIKDSNREVVFKYIVGKPEKKMKP
jgi:hypothetical protein